MKHFILSNCLLFSLLRSAIGEHTRNRRKEWRGKHQDSTTATEGQVSGLKIPPNEYELFAIKKLTHPDSIHRKIRDGTIWNWRKDDDNMQLWDL
jgi:hypothetical protein